MLIQTIGRTTSFDTNDTNSVSVFSLYIYKINNRPFFFVFGNTMLFGIYVLIELHQRDIYVNLYDIEAAGSKTLMVTVYTSNI